MATWQEIGKTIAPLAPMAGSILGGLIPFPGAAIIGKGLGELIARQFGVAPTPDAVAAKVAATPEAEVIAKINQAVELARVQVQGFTDIEKAYLDTVKHGLTVTGQTMSVEYANQHWYFTGWRPAIGWVFVTFAISFGVMLTLAGYAAAWNDNEKPLKILTDAWPIFLAYFGTLSLMVGVYIPSRSLEKTAIIKTPALPAIDVQVPAQPNQITNNVTVKPTPPKPPVNPVQPNRLKREDDQ